MLFDVKVKNKGVVETWLWGTKSCSVTNAHGVRLNPKSDGWMSMKPYERKRENARMLELFLGYNCNLNCKYCYQRDDRERYAGVQGTPDKVDGFITKLKATGIQLKEIAFWGGEPLVFWKTIVKLIPPLEEMYPGVRFRLNTNGKLLTKELIDYMSARNIFLSVSCDANSEGREYNVVEDKKDVLVYAMTQMPNRFAFNSVIYRGNEDMSKTMAFFRKHFGPNVPVGAANPTRCIRIGHSSQEMCYVDTGKLTKTLTKELMTPYQKNPGKSRMMELVRAIRRRTETNFERGFCGIASGQALCCDMDGNMFTCHMNATRVIGNLSHFKDAPLKPYFTVPLDRAICRHCPYVPVCHGYCPSLNDEAHKVSCIGAKAVAAANFAAAWMRIFSVEVLEVTEHKKEAENG